MPGTEALLKNNDSEVNGRDGQEATPTSDEVQVSFVPRQSIVSVQGYATDPYPMDFAQDFKSLTYPMTTEPNQHGCHSQADNFYCDDNIVPDYVTAMDAPSSLYVGSWDGRCVAQRPEDADYKNCRVFLRIAGVDIEQHITGEGCPSQVQGRKSGHVKQIVRDEMISILSGDEIVLLYSEIVVQWLHGAAPNEEGRWVRAIISTGSSETRSNDDILKIIWAQPDRTEWPPRSSWFDANLPLCTQMEARSSMSGCLQNEKQCRHKLLPFGGASRKATQQAAIHAQIAYEVKAVSSCNESVALVHELAEKSSACRTLVESLLLRDTLEMLSPTFSGTLCTSPCKADLDEALDHAVNVCSGAWRRSWTKADYQGILFKQLLTVATAKYWLFLDCATNRHRTSCMGAARMTALHANTACSAYAGKQLPPVNPFVNMECSKGCQAALDDFVRDEHCCVATLEDADRMYFNTIYHPHISTIEADLRDRSNPFDFNDVAGNLSTFSLVANPLPEDANATTDDLNRDCSGRMTASCATRFCLSTNWELSCCDGLSCINGYKLYPGACSCVCPAGFSGRYIDRDREDGFV